MDFAAFDQLLDHILAVFVALEPHFEGNLLGIEVGVFLALAGRLLRVLVLEHASRRAVGGLLNAPRLLVLVELLHLGLDRLAHFGLHEVLVRGALPRLRFVSLPPLLLLIHVVRTDQLALKMDLKDAWEECGPGRDWVVFVAEVVPLAPLVHEDAQIG